MAELTQAEFDAEMEKKAPWIEWRKPIPIAVGDRRKGLGCRLCIAHDGFRASDGTLFDTLEEFEAHMREKHEQRSH